MIALIPGRIGQRNSMARWATDKNISNISIQKANGDCLFPLLTKGHGDYSEGAAIIHMNKIKINGSYGLG
jgi:hypothetical protein